MQCLTCFKDSTHIRVTANGTIGCHNCMGFSESGGSSTDKILTRNAARVTDEQIQYEGDMITPYVIDKTTNQPVVNEEFLNLYPDQAAGTYTADELKSVGQPDLKPPEAEDKSNIEFSGDENTAIADIIEA